MAIWRWNPLLHIGQWYGKLLVWVVKCSAKWSFLKNLFWQTRHSYGLTPVCRILCRRMLAPFENFILHTSHSNIFLCGRVSVFCAAATLLLSGKHWPICVDKVRTLEVEKLLQVVHFKVVPLFDVSLLTVATGSFFSVFKFGDTVPESASVSPLDDITIPIRDLPEHHSPALL